MESIEPLEALVAALVADAPTTTLETLAGKLGLKLDRRGKIKLAHVLKRRGWQRQQFKRGGKVQSYWQPAELDPDERALRKFLVGRANVTIAECCYGLHWLPLPTDRARIAAWLTAYGWQRAARDPEEFNRSGGDGP